MKRAAISAPNLPGHINLLRNILRRSTVIDHLQAVAVLEPDAFQILPTAYRSAEDVKQFEHIDELRNLLWLLATKYRQALLDGKGDQEACRVFGRKEFTTRESDNLSKAGRQARTFEFNGKSVVMEQHLKIGVKDSEAHCLRIHFLWDASSRKIVIGHCGKHLPL